MSSVANELPDGETARVARYSRRQRPANVA